MTLLARWIILALSVLAASWLATSLGVGFLARVETFGDFLKLMLGVAILAFLNVTLGTVLKILTIPLNCMTLGLFSFVINAFMLYLASQANLGFTLTDKEGGGRFWSALIASILISLINGLLGAVLVRDKDPDD